MTTYLGKTPSSTARGRRRTAFTSLAAISLALSVAGCSGSVGDSGENVASSSAALTGGDVLAFESPSGWTVSSGTVAATTTRTQGADALAVTAPQNYTTLVSAKLASNLPALAGLATTGANVSIDLQLPTSQPNPSYFGALQLFVSAPAEGVFNQYLGQSLLTGQPLGTFQTYSFAVTDFVIAQLTGKTFSDLTFTVALNAPAGAKGTYIFDNLRTRSPSTAPAGVGPSVDLTATLSTNPTTNTPGSASFTAGTIQIPSGFHVNVGNAGTGTATLALGLGSTTSVTCTYAASSDKTAYAFKSCTTSNLAGDIVAASTARLTIVSADPTAALTKIKAQLAYNALGDQIGSKLLPAIPTFWGVTPQDISAISVAFANALNTPTTGQQFITLPVPDFALRHGDGSPVDTSNGQPPPPNDPPFNKSGHLNNGGSFDAYWQVQGNFADSGANDDLTTSMNATASVHAVVMGHDETVADVVWTSNTDTGTLTPTGLGAGTASAHVTSHVFGSTVEDNSLSAPGSVAVFPPLHLDHQFPVVSFNYLVFSVTGNIDGIVDLKTTGTIATTGQSVVVTPSVAAGVSLVGAINVLVASGNLTGTVELINVGTPVTANANWTISRLPSACNATLNGDINGQLTLSSLGGNITANATVGSCSFFGLCKHFSDTLLSWKALPIAKTQIFDFPLLSQTVPLSASLCPLEPLTVTIQSPTPGTSVLAGTPVPLQASAVRPDALGIGGQPVDCQFITWSSSDPNATFSAKTGCTPTVTFGSADAGTTQTLTATATDQFGETGSASTTVNLPAQQQLGPVVQILSLSPTPVFWASTETLQVQVTEVASASSGPQTITVNCTDTFPQFSGSGTTTEAFGSATTFTTSGGGTTSNVVTLTGIPGIPGGDEGSEFGVGNNTISCVATDANNVTSQPNVLAFFVQHVIQ